MDMDMARHYKCVWPFLWEFYLYWTVWTRRGCDRKCNIPYRAVNIYMINLFQLQVKSFLC